MVDQGVTYDCGAWVRLESGNPALLLQVANPADAGAWTTVAVALASQLTAEWQRISASVVAEGSQLDFRIITSGVTTASGYVHVDDAEVWEVAITKAIKDALVADLEYITVAHGYATEVKQVSREPIEPDLLQKPGIAIIPETGGESDESELGNITGAAVQRFRLQLVLGASSTPNDDMDDFLDDVRNAIERSASNTLAASGVIKTTVNSWTEVMTGKTVHDNTLYYREAAVSVDYEYTRGAA